MSETPGGDGPGGTAGGVGGHPEGHPEGEWVVDPSGRHQYRYVVHGQPTEWVSDSGVETLDDHAEWRPDPTGRHQSRYFVRGEPTPAVSDNGVQSTDPLAPVPAAAAPVAGGRRLPLWPFLVGGALVALLVVIVVVALVTRDDKPSTPTTQPTPTFSPSPTTTPPTPTTEPTTSAPPTSVPSGGRIGPISVFDLQPGDCIITPSGPTATGVPCAQAHDFEVYAVFEVPGASGAAYPGDATISDLADTGCQGQRFTDYVGQDYASSAIFATSLSPSEATWTQQDDREVVCMARAQSGQLTGSVRNSNQ